MKLTSRFLRFVLAPAAILLGLSGSAWGGAVTYYGDTGGLLTLNFSDQLISLPKFDTSLGSLTAVKVTFLGNGTNSESYITTNGWLQNGSGLGSATADFSQRAQIKPVASTDPGLSFTMNMDAYIMGDSGAILNADTLSAFSGTVFAIPNTSFTLPPSGVAQLENSTNDTVCPSQGAANCDTVVWNVSQALASNHTYNVSAGNFSSYQGAGNWDLHLQGSALYFGSTPGSTNNYNLTQADVFVSVEYDYTATPEPATMGLMGGSLLFVGFFVKKFARRQK
jgi:hypothetical protein